MIFGLAGTTRPETNADVFMCWSWKNQTKKNHNPKNLPATSI